MAILYRIPALLHHVWLALQITRKFGISSPLPGTGTLTWSFIEPPRSVWNNHGKERNFLQVREVPVDVILSLLMLSRVYLVGRWQVLHSKQFQAIFSLPQR